MAKPISHKLPSPSTFPTRIKCLTPEEGKRLTDLAAAGKTPREIMSVEFLRVDNSRAPFSTYKTLRDHLRRKGYRSSGIDSPMTLDVSLLTEDEFRRYMLGID